MVAYRSRRLETVLGARIGDVSFQQMSALVSGQVQEAFDLDFKSELYGSSDKHKRDMAGDVAALANTGGGLIVIGIEEDDQARATRMKSVALSDGEVARMHQVIAAGTAPVPEFDIRAIEDPLAAGTGVLVVAVPRSARQPHGVLINDGLRFPRRNGSTIRYLSEPEVAAAYRERFATASGQVERLGAVERDLEERLQRDQVWVVVSLVPDLPGDLVIDATTVASFRKEIVGTDPMLVQEGTYWNRTSVGVRRLVADNTVGNSPAAEWLAAELHSDGSGTFGMVPNTLDMDTADAPGVRRISDEALVLGVVAGLRVVARHARDRAAAGGNALVRASIVIQPQLVSPGPGRSVRLELGHNRGPVVRPGIEKRLGNADTFAPVHSTDQAAPLDALAEDGPELLSTAYLLSSDLVQAFGHPEPLQLTRDGRLRREYWHRERWAGLGSWADASDIGVIEGASG